jgi:hypothetical protein
MGDTMTHRERAEAAAAEILKHGAVTDTFIREIIWRACVEGCNDELERRREEERAKRLAMRIQAALEERNARLERWLEQLDNLVRAALEGNPHSTVLNAARQILYEFECEDGTI